MLWRTLRPMLQRPWRAAVMITVHAALALPAILHAAPFAYITNQGSHDVSVIDLASQAVVATVPVGRSPAGVVASSRAGKVFISNPDSRDISVIDMRSMQVVATLPAGDGPVGIDASADGQQLFVADWYRNRLLLINPARPQDTPAAITLGRAPAGVAAHPDNRTVFVAERDDDSVAVVDLPSRSVRARVAVGSHPFALLLDLPRQRLYALNVQSNSVSVIKLQDAMHPTVVATLKTGNTPYGAALSADGRRLFVTNQHADTVSLFDADSLQLITTLTGFAYPEGIAAHASEVYVVNWMDDKVSVLDASTGRLLRQISTGKNSRGFGAFIGAPIPP